MGINSPLEILALFLIGIFAHGFFAVFNELMDVEEDKRLGNLFAHPLASGEFERKKARSMVMAFPILAIVLAFLIFEGIAPILFLSISLALFTAYNVLNKTLPGTEFVLASAFTSLALFGCAAGGFSNSIIAIAFSFATGIHALNILTIYLGLWHAQFWREDVKMTLAHFLGARKRGERLIPTVWFLAYGSILQTLFFGAILLPFILGEMTYNRGQIVTLFLVILGAIFVTYRVMAAQIYNPRKIARSSASHYILVGAALPLMLASINVWVMLIALFPLLEVYLVTRSTGGSIISPPMGTMPARKENPEEN